MNPVISLLLDRYLSFFDSGDERSAGILWGSLAADHVGADGQGSIQCGRLLQWPIRDKCPAGGLGRIDDDPLVGALKRDRDRLAPFSMRPRKSSGLWMLIVALIGRFVLCGEAAI